MGGDVAMMTRPELERRLVHEGIRPDAYDLESRRSRDEVYCLERGEAGWVVYYRERGLRREERVFPSETDACCYFLDLILTDPTTRISR